MSKQKFKQITKDEVNFNMVKNQVEVQGHSITEAVKNLCAFRGIEYSDNLRRRFSERLAKTGITKPLEDLVEDTVTETNQYEVSTVLSARKPNGQIMTIQEYCDTYNIPREEVRSYKLVTHTGIPFYNIASGNVQDLGITAEEFIDNFVDKIKDHSPKYEPFELTDSKQGNLLVIDPADVHVGKLATTYETGEEYNSDIAVRKCIEGVQGVVSKSRSLGIDKILLIVGNDILHYDTPKRTTTSGTPQDTDIMFYTMFNMALDLYVSIIESLRVEFEVDVIFCPSNHDYQSGWMLARTLSTWFRNCDNVKIDDSINHRKYYRYGKNLLGFSHGDGAKMTDMPLLMANEVPDKWSETKYRYIYLHHIHHKQVNKFQSAKDYIGVTVEYLRSPSSADSWHHRNGYVGSKKAVEGFVHNEVDGQIARITNYF